MNPRSRAHTPLPKGKVAVSVRGPLQGQTQEQHKYMSLDMAEVGRKWGTWRKRKADGLSYLPDWITCILNAGTVPVLRIPHDNIT